MRAAWWCALLALLGLACSREASDLREWRASDHDHTGSPSPGQVPASPDNKPGGVAAMLGIDEVVLTTWKRQCTECHGMIGHGDGPRGAETEARNLADPEWQAKVEDDALATSIRKGKGKMPAFKLPDSTITGLVKFVRKMAATARPPSGPSAAAAPSAAAPASSQPAPAASTP
ncbi:MAG: cytochrome c [Polyangiaceae bacterium]